MSKHVRRTPLRRLAENIRPIRNYVITGAVVAVAGGLFAPSAFANAAQTLGIGVVHNRNIAYHAVTDSKINFNGVGYPKLSTYTRNKIEKSSIKGVHADEPYKANLPGQDSSGTTVPAGETKVVWTACAPGEAAVGGGYRIGDLSQEAFNTGKTIAYPDLQVIASEGAWYDSDSKQLENAYPDHSVNDNGSFRPNAWAVTVHNAGTTDSVARAQVVCAKV